MGKYEDWNGRVVANSGPTYYRPIDPVTGKLGERRIAEPHEMTREEFERDRDTLWHATPSGAMGDGVIHFGTQKAAYTAVTANLAGGNADSLRWQPGDPIEELRSEIAARPGKGYGGPKDWHAEQPAFIALRVAPGREDAMVDVHDELGYEFKGGDMGSEEGGLSGDAVANQRVRPYSKMLLEEGDVEGAAEYHAGRHGGEGYWYANESEDVGSISGVVPHKSWLWTHRDFVVAALERGIEIDEDVLMDYPDLMEQVEQGIGQSVEPGTEVRPSLGSVAGEADELAKGRTLDADAAVDSLEL